MWRAIAKRGYTRVLTKETIGENVRNAEYAIRGYIVQLADELAARMKKGEKLPFKKFFPCNIGNPLTLGQPTLTFDREVVAAALRPGLLDSASISHDAKERARRFITHMAYPPAIGAYTESAGIPMVLESVKKFIEERDGHPANASDIFLVNGASDGVTTLLNTVISGPKDAVSTKGHV
jgi:alanine transaminase